jgi:hypothetical protein
MDASFTKLPASTKFPTQCSHVTTSTCCQVADAWSCATMILIDEAPLQRHGAIRSCRKAEIPHTQ